MHRREFLNLAGAAALTAAYGSRTEAAAASGERVVIIGAGILGVTIAYQLAKRGARVTILEKSTPASGATGDSFAYLNASTKPERPYYELNLLGIAGWRRLQLELQGALPLQWGGSVYWRDEAAAAAQLLSTVRRYQEWGYAGRQIRESDLQHLLPSARLGLVEGAVFYEQEGTLDPVGAVNVLLARAKKLGASLETAVEVQGFETADDRIRTVRTSRGPVNADFVIVAAGLGSKPLIDSLGLNLPLTSSTGVLIHTVPQRSLLQTVAFAPGSTIKQNPDGRVVSSSGHEGSNLSLDVADQGRQILSAAARYFPQLRDTRIERVSIGQRVLPRDGFPILGFPAHFRNLYLTVTHSGVTLAPVIAQFAAQEICDGVVLEPLAPYRLSRFGSPL